jgi:hypothetical protein
MALAGGNRAGDDSLHGSERGLIEYHQRAIGLDHPMTGSAVAIVLGRPALPACPNQGTFLMIAFPPWPMHEPPVGLPSDLVPIFRCANDSICVMQAFCSGWHTGTTPEFFQSWHDCLWEVSKTFRRWLVANELSLRADCPESLPALVSINATILDLDARLHCMLPLQEPDPSDPTLAAIVGAIREAETKNLTNRAQTVFDGFRIPNDLSESLRTALAKMAALPKDYIYVDLDQIAACVNRKKRTFEALKTRITNPLPEPDCPGGGGHKDEWLWSNIKPWLEKEFGRKVSVPPRQLI